MKGWTNMNAARRKRLAEAVDMIASAKEIIEEVKEEEQEAFDNMPESLQGSERGEDIYITDKSAVPARFRNNPVLAHLEKNIFRYPELSGDTEKASRFISDFEEKKTLGSIVQESLSDKSQTGIQVYIGNEMPMEGMQDCSVVTATYDLGKGMKGTVGVIGPKRMDYDRVIDVLKQIMSQLDDLYKK